MIILGLDTQGAVAKARLDYRDESRTYMSTNLIFTGTFTFLVAVLINILYAWLKGIIGLTRFETNLMIVYGYALYLISFITAENNFDYQFKKNLIISGVASLLNLALSVLLIVTIFNNDRLSGRIIGATLPMGFCGFIVYIHICKRGKWKYNRKHIRYALKFCIPLIPHNLSHIILSSADRIMIKNMISASDAGIYSLSYNLGMLLTVVSEGMNQAFGPWLFRKIDRGETEDVTKAQRLYLLAYAVIAIAVMTISPEIVKLIGAREYWDGIKIVVFVVFAVFLNFTYTLYVNIEFYYLKSNWISIGTFAAALINCGLNLIFLKQYGYIFGAYSTVVSYAALLIFHVIIVNCVMKKRYIDNRFVFLVALFMLCISFCMNLLLGHIMLRIGLGIVAEFITLFALYKIYKRQGGIGLSSVQEGEETIERSK